MTHPLITDELNLLESLVPLAQARIVEIGCGAARLARSLVERHRAAEVDGIDIDARQLARNLTEPLDRLRFERAGAEAMPFDDDRFDGALMLKSLHHVPLDLMESALSEAARVLVPHGWLYVSEPVYDGDLNEIVRLFNDEGRVRAAAQAALDGAIAAGVWVQETERRFDMPVHFPSFEAFEQQAMRPSFADHRIDDAMVDRVRERFRPHLGPGGASFTRPMHVRLLRKAR